MLDASQITDPELLRQIVTLQDREIHRLHQRLAQLCTQLAKLRGTQASKQLEMELVRLQEQLAAAANMSIPTIKRLEAHDGPLGGRAETGKKIQAALEKAGVEFIDENGGGPGVRLRKSGYRKASE